MRPVFPSGNNPGCYYSLTHLQGNDKGIYDGRTDEKVEIVFGGVFLLDSLL